MNDEERWQQLRGLFDAVCDLPPERWRAELERLTTDPALLRETLDLLGAQTVSLERARAPLDGLLARLAAPELQPGDTLGPWRLTGRLASGGMGVVFAAERADDLYQQRVAVKLLRGLPDPRTAERLAEERRILAGLQHPNIARLYDGGTTAAGLPYLVMEFVDGQPLDAYCHEHGPDLRQRLALFVRICRAVQAAHAHLVVHCDLKPGNILVRTDGEPVLLDFGIARLLDSAGQGERTAYCTPAYAAPETLAGQPVGMASDVFSLGVILVELLADRRVERDPDDRQRPVVAPSDWAGADCPWRRRLPGDLDAIARRACALEAGARYASVEALANDVQRYLDHRAVVARQGSRLYRAGRGLRRHWRGASVAALVLGLSGAFVWRLGEERARAQEEAQVAEQIAQFMLQAFEAADPRKRGKGEAEATAREVLDAGVARIDSELAGSPAMRARVRHVIGQAYMNVGQGQRGEALLRVAAESLLSPEVDRPLEAADAMNELAVLLANGKRGEEAEQVARRSLQVVAASGGDPGLEARAWNSLGLALMSQERFEGALEAFQRSLALRASLPDFERGRSRVNHNIGLLHQKWGRLEEAERLLRQSLATKTELDGAASFEVWTTRHVLANTVVEQGRLRDAEALQQQNLALALKLFGEDSDNTATVYNELASINQDLGDYRAATGYYARALQIQGRVLGEDSVDYAVTLNNFASLEESRGNTEEAARMYRRSFEVRKARLGADNGTTLRAEANLGRALMRNGDLAAAEPLIGHALAVWSSRLEPDARDVLITRLGMAEWQVRSGRFADAHAALDALRPLLADKPPQLVFRHQSLLAELLQREGRVDDAVRAWQDAVDMAEAQYGTDTISTARHRVPLAEALLEAGQPAQAREQAARAAPLLREQLVPGSELPRRLARLESRLGIASPPAAGNVQASAAPAP
ncbi:tetratricopeptide repeat protein [Pseudoxanthomonas sp. 10H]|uniref:tetratricopeptide repeat protein n=1 Tax=Pseudoxanthomonas sp. 10H TaxID=3242729 RepID=UPI003557F2A2